MMLQWLHSLNTMKQVGILIFDGVEVLDFAGPFEVFSVAKGKDGTALFKVHLIAEQQDVIKARNDFQVLPHFTMQEAPDLDILLIPGGYGTRKEMYNSNILNWVKEQNQQLELLLSVCTGALILGEAGLLDGLNATTHHGAFKELEAAAPNTAVIRNQTFVDNGKIITSAGISAGIIMALHVVKRLHGKDIANATSSYMEYDHTFK